SARSCARHPKPKSFERCSNKFSSSGQDESKIRCYQSCCGAQPRGAKQFSAAKSVKGSCYLAKMKILLIGARGQLAQDIIRAAAKGASDEIIPVTHEQLDIRDAAEVNAC